MVGVQFEMEERNFLMLEYHKRKGTRNFVPQLLADFAQKFPGARVPHRNTLVNVFKKA